MTEDFNFSGFPQSVLDIFVTVPRIFHKGIFPNSFHFISHPTFRRYIISLTTTAGTFMQKSPSWEAYRFHSV